MKTLSGINFFPSIITKSLLTRQLGRKQRTREILIWFMIKICLEEY